MTMKNYDQWKKRVQRDVALPEKGTTEMKMALIAAALLALGGPAAAQDSDWTYRASMYLWLPKTTTTLDTPRGSVTSEVSVSSLLKALDFGFMGAFEASKGRWSFIGDLVYSDISSDAPTPFGKLFSEVAGKTTLTIFSGYALYRVTDDPKLSFDIGGGVRVLSNDITLTLTAGDLPEESTSVSSTWVDPLIAARVRYKFSDKWFGGVLADAGGFDAGSDSTWQVIATVGYQISDKWALQAGYRYLNAENQDNGRDVQLELSGPVFGATYRF